MSAIIQSTRSTSTSNVILALSCFFLPLAYTVLYAPYGLDFIDSGFILGYAWRIYNGAIPYQDFLYVRPPLTPLLHSWSLILLPDEVQLIAERSAFYFTVSAYCLFTIKILETHLPLRDTHLYFAAFFIFSVHNFPPMPWHTVDGIFMTTLGLFLLSRRCMVAGSIVLIAAALTKQSFYPAPLIGLIYSIFYLEKRHTTTLLLVTILTLVAFFIILYSLGISTLYIEQTTSQTGLKELLDAGFTQYFKEAHKLALIPLVVFVVMRKTQYAHFARQTSLWLFLAIIFTDYLITYTSKQRFIIPPHGMPQALFILAVIYTLIQYRRNIHQHNQNPWIAVLMLLSISWCSSISWGYLSPILFAAPMIFCLVQLYQATGSSSRFLCFLAAGGAIMFFVAMQYPYGNKPRSELIYPASDVFSKLHGIYTDKESLEKLSELRNLSKTYPCFKTLPSMPLANYLTDTQSPLPIDWPLNIEISYRAESLYTTLTKSGCVAFIEKNQINPPESAVNSPFGSKLTYLITHRWQATVTTPHFVVYQADTIH